ncbi:TRAP transporter substrate-binding protein DctP [Ornithinimicrobium cavernae]|uniref:TRAP transporter substrate-binding protein DctP n=1 Tax=Ornithinimicrobium cavernae TaxID=2666047 RepID=UPI000D693429|nr:TRAP transporter substrate-binding protein DctP [Ornithinimicrobium cavernae]
MNTRRNRIQASRRRPYALGAALTGVALVATACGGSSAGSGEGDELTLTFSSALAPDTAVNQQAQWYMDKVTELTDGRVQWDTYYAGALLSSTETVTGVADGRADMAYFASAYDPGTLPLLDIGFVPVTDTDSVGNALAWRDLYESNEALQQETANAGIHILFMNGVANLSNVAMPEKVASVSELEGKQIRVIGAASAAVESLGASPVSLAAEEIYESVERGVIGGIGGTSIESVIGQGYEEVAPWMHYLPFGNYGSSLGVIMGENRWNDLPPEVQDAFEKATEAYYEELPTMLAAGEEEACDALLEAGGGVVILPSDDAEKAAVVEAVGDAPMQIWRDNAKRSGASEQSIAQIEKAYTETARSLAGTADYTPGEQLCAARSE